MSSKLKKIVAEAKKIRAKKPSIKWTNAIKEASKKIGSYSVQENAKYERKNKSKKKVPKKLRVKRNDDGTFKKFTKISGVSDITTGATLYKQAVGKVSNLKKSKATKTEIAKAVKAAKALKQYLQQLL